MRLKTALWVSAYLRRCQVEGVAAVVRRRGAEEAGAVFIRICRLDCGSDLFGPAPQSEFDAVRDADRAFSPSLKERPGSKKAVEAYLAREIRFDPDVWIVEVEDRAGRAGLESNGSACLFRFPGDGSPDAEASTPAAVRACIPCTGFAASWLCSFKFSITHVPREA